MEERRYFTRKEANEQLPWLEAQLQLIAETRAGMGRLQGEMNGLQRHARRNGHSSTQQDLVTKRKEINTAANQLARLLQEVHARGIIVRDTERGLVDFPSLKEGHAVYLCWLRGESRIAFWHEADAGFDARQPLSEDDP